MDCDRLREVLIDHVDGLLGREEADAARDHLGGCGPCRALQEEVRRNFTALDAWEDEDLPVGALARLEARIAGMPSLPVPAAPSAPSRPASGLAASPRKSWVRLAIPYAAGLATAAAVTWVFVLPHGAPLPSPREGAPAAPGPAVPSLARPGAPVAAGGGGGGGLRPGESPLEFRDAGHGVLRRLRLPPGVDPGSVQLVDTQPRFLQDDEGVR